MKPIYFKVGDHIDCAITQGNEETFIGVSLNIGDYPIDYMEVSEDSLEWAKMIALLRAKLILAKQVRDIEKQIKELSV